MMKYIEILWIYYSPARNYRRNSGIIGNPIFYLIWPEKSVSNRSKKIFQSQKWEERPQSEVLFDKIEPVLIYCDFGPWNEYLLFEIRLVAAFLAELALIWPSVERNIFYLKSVWMSKTLQTYRALLSNIFYLKWCFRAIDCTWRLTDVLISSI